MIRLLIVGDGERDLATLPCIIKGILGSDVQSIPRHWARLHGKGRHGFGPKLRFAQRQALDQGCSGMAAVVDRDRDARGTRLRSLVETRKETRKTAAAFPTAMGEAIPHGEAWLLDDPATVRQVLRLGPEQPIPTVRRASSPKRELERLVQESPRSEEKMLDLLQEIARELQPERCRHCGETGFLPFVKEVRRELGSLAGIVR